MKVKVISKFDLDHIYTNNIQNAIYHNSNRSLNITSSDALNMSSSGNTDISVEGSLTITINLYISYPKYNPCKNYFKKCNSMIDKQSKLLQ